MKRLLIFLFLFVCSVSGAQAAALSVSKSDFGVYVSTRGLYASTNTWATELDLARNMNVGLIRSNWDMMDVIWPSATTWSFTAMDTVAQMIAARGMQIYFTMPWRATWQTGHGSCQGTNPYRGTGTPGTTQCPTIDLEQIRIFTSSFTTRYDSYIVTYEIPFNEPDLLCATTDVAHIAAIAAVQAKAILDINPNARIALPALAGPWKTLLNGNLTAATTTFFGGHFLADFYNKFSSSMAYIGHGVTMSSFTTSVHSYFEASGGQQSNQIVMTTVTYMSSNAGNSAPVVDFSEVNVAGGTPTGPSSNWSLNMSSAIVSAFAVMKSSNSAWAATGSRFIVHNMEGLPISITTTSYSPLGVYNVSKRLFELDYCSAQGDQGDGVNIRLYKFTCPNSTVWMVWRESGSGSWALNPTNSVRVTTMDGKTELIPASSFTPYTLTTNRLIVEEFTKSHGRNFTGIQGTFQ